MITEIDWIGIPPKTVLEWYSVKENEKSTWCIYND